MVANWGLHITPPPCSFCVPAPVYGGPSTFSMNRGEEPWAVPRRVLCLFLLAPVGSCVCHAGFTLHHAAIVADTVWASSTSNAAAKIALFAAFFTPARAPVNCSFSNSISVGSVLWTCPENPLTSSHDHDRCGVAVSTSSKEMSLSCTASIVVSIGTTFNCCPSTSIGWHVKRGWSDGACDVACTAALPCTRA